MYNNLNITVMKKFIFILTAMIACNISANAMSYEQAREQALFLTDKMAYELNLTDAQYEAAYEVNLDYLMGVNTYDDVFGTYWTRRNLDLQYIFYDWQYQLYLSANYFYRPLYWDAGYWHFRIYTIYPQRTYFYFGRPDFYWNYRGDHCWRHFGGGSWYHGRTFGHGGFGMRDGWHRGDFNPGGRCYTERRFANTGRHGNFSRGEATGRRMNGQRNMSGRNGSTNVRNSIQRDARNSSNTSGRRGRVSSTRSTVNGMNSMGESSRYGQRSNSMGSRSNNVGSSRSSMNRNGSMRSSSFGQSRNNGMTGSSRSSMMGGNRMNSMSGSRSSMSSGSRMGSMSSGARSSMSGGNRSGSFSGSRGGGAPSGSRGGSHGSSGGGRR